MVKDTAIVITAGQYKVLYDQSISATILMTLTTLNTDFKFTRIFNAESQ